MNDRRRFLHVLGATTAAVTFPACGGTDTTTGTGTTGAGGGTGGSTSSVTGSTTSGTTSSPSSASATSSTGTGGNCEMNPTGTAVGVSGDFAAEGLHLVPGTKVLIGRDAKGLYALTSLCTHQLCNMNAKNGMTPWGTPTPQGITCTCHGSKFDTLGNAVSPPPKEPSLMLKPLKAYAMALGCDGKLYVDITTQVPNTQRLMA